jgi:hypothetical protein
MMKRIVKHRKTKKSVRPVAESSHTFECGDPAILVFPAKGRRIKLPVTIAEVIYSASLDSSQKSCVVHRICAYKVRSEFGGELTVSPDSLRPGTVLDRINAALED